MAVLAHPDDEATTIGGTLALYAARGVRTVLVTCTNGEFGDRPYGRRPDPDHDTRAAAAARLAELHRSCEHLSVDTVELLGYHDSGTVEWEQPYLSTLFRGVPVERVAGDIGRLLEQHRPQVVLTHEPDSTRHPDHRHAAQATALAVESTSIAAKLYYSAHGTRYWRRVYEALADNGFHRPTPDPDRVKLTDRIDRAITTTIDVGSVLDRKRQAVYAHTDQLADSTAAKVPENQWATVFAEEDYIRIHDTTAAPTPETDLFAGITD